MFADITVEIIFAYFIVFCRIGSAIMLMPGLSESYISTRARLVTALTITIVVTPLLEKLIPPMPKSTIGFMLIVMAEVIIGILIGSIAKILLSAIHVAGQTISFQIGLSAANIFDPSQGGQSSTVGMFLNTVAILLIFTTDLHHIFLTGVVDSYHLFNPANALPIGGFTDLVTKTVSSSFLIGIKIAAPQLVIGLLLFLGAGVMGRLMPQMQVFFVLMPLQIMIGFFIIMVTLSAGMMMFINFYGETLANFIN